MVQWWDVHNWLGGDSADGGDTDLGVLLNQQIRDQMLFLKSRPYNDVTIAATTTTSTSFVQMTGASVALTSYGGAILIVFDGTQSNSGLNLNSWDLAVDGLRVGDATNGLTGIKTPVANRNDSIVLPFITTSAPPAGNHTYTVYWKTAAGTLSGAGRLYVTEIN